MAPQTEAELSCQVQVWSYEPQPEDEGLAGEDGYEGGYKLAALQHVEKGCSPWWEVEHWQPLGMQERIQQLG